jgi:hypothetical protein
MLHLTEEIASYVHRACRGAIGKTPTALVDPTPQQVFYRRTLEEALRVFGSRVLYPSRPVLREEELYALYVSPDTSEFPREELETLVDFLVMHKDYEAHRGKYWRTPVLIEQGIEMSGKKFQYLTRQLGQLLGNQLYEGYLAGLVSKRMLRSLFFVDLTVPGAAESAYFATARRCAKKTRNFVS